MRTLIIVAIGIVAGLAVLWLLRRQRNAPMTGFWAFAALWLITCAWNLSVGVSHGYSVAEEIPFLLVNFLVPVAVVWALRNRIGKVRG